MLNKGVSFEGHFPNLQCTTNDTDGWDYVCTYVDRRTGQPRKLGVKASADGIQSISGWVQVSEPLPPH